MKKNSFPVDTKSKSWKTRKYTVRHKYLADKQVHISCRKYLEL